MNVVQVVVLAVVAQVIEVGAVQTHRALRHQLFVVGKLQRGRQRQNAFTHTATRNDAVFDKGIYSRLA